MGRPRKARDVKSGRRLAWLLRTCDSYPEAAARAVVARFYSADVKKVSGVRGRISRWMDGQVPMPPAAAEVAQALGADEAGGLWLLHGGPAPESIRALAKTAPAMRELEAFMREPEAALLEEPPADPAPVELLAKTTTGKMEDPSSLAGRCEGEKEASAAIVFIQGVKAELTEAFNERSLERVALAVADIDEWLKLKERKRPRRHADGAMRPQRLVSRARPSAAA